MFSSSTITLASLALLYSLYLSRKRQDIEVKHIRNKMRVMTVSTVYTETCLKPRIFRRDTCTVVNLCRFPFKLDFNICHILTTSKIGLENWYKPPLQAKHFLFSTMMHTIIKSQEY
jgi:hypothetical protein